MREPPAVIREDFNRIACADPQAWNHNNQYHAFLLRQLPARCREALDIGCGTGTFSRLLAARSDRVTAVDLSPEMIRIAREQSADHPNIDYRPADVFTWPWPKGRFDCIASIAVLHHLPMEEILRRCEKSLAPEGVLLVLDLYQASSLTDYLAGAAALPAAAALRLARTGRLLEPRAVREAWARHGEHERYPALAEVRRICAAALPGATVRRHLLWRYSIVWSKAADVSTAGGETRA